LIRSKLIADVKVESAGAAVASLVDGNAVIEAEWTDREIQANAEAEV
jgi:sulfur carrier protein ThiS